MAYLPPLLVLLFATWAGTLPGAATLAGAATGSFALLAVVTWMAARELRRILRGEDAGDARPMREMLGPGPVGPALFVVAALTVAISWATSPVPRAGWTAVLLVPAFLLLPRVVAVCWCDSDSRRRGLAALAAGVAAVSAWALIDHLWLGSPRAAMPLGHHNLLAIWLLAVLPPALLPLRRPGPERWLAAAAGSLGVAALLATRSLAGWAGLALLLGLGAVGIWHGRRRPRGDHRGEMGRTEARPAPRAVAAAAGLVLATVVGAALVAPRLPEIAAGRDPSLQARWVYFQAGLEGLAERPLLGWGPGATPWTLGLHLEPVPGVNPPGEVVAQLHGQPLQLAYELGGVGLALLVGLGALFLRARWRELRPALAAESSVNAVGGGDVTAPSRAADPLLLAAGLAGLGACGVALLGTAALDVPAIPVALLLAVASAWIGGEPATDGDRREAPILAVVAGVYALALALHLALVPFHAWSHYEGALAVLERAEEGGDSGGRARSEAVERMGRAAALDPSFPWYQAWVAWLTLERAGATAGAGGRGAMPGDGPSVGPGPAEAILLAANGAPGVGALWLSAGVEGLGRGASWAPGTLARACRLDPLGPLAPFHLLRAAPEDAGAPRRAARALLAEPRLLAATFWRGRGDLRRAALAEVEAWPGVPGGWKAALLERARDPRLDLEALRAAAGETGTGAVALRLDRQAASSLALHAFRRRPRSRALGPVAVDAMAVRAVDLPPAAVLPETAPEAFGERGCTSP